MIRSILSALGALLGTLLIYVLLPSLGVIIIAAILLGVGALLARVFPVTVFEASLIVTLVAIPLFWMWLRLLGNLNAVNVNDELQESEAPSRALDRIIMVSPRPTRRSKKKDR